MNISELIVALTDMLNQHGDVEVLFYDDWAAFVGGITYDSGVDRATQMSLNDPAIIICADGSYWPDSPPQRHRLVK